MAGACACCPGGDQELGEILRGFRRQALHAEKTRSGASNDW